MLNKILQLGKKFVITVMLSLLVLSFAIWGVGDVFRSSASDAVAVVGEESISAFELKKIAKAEAEKIKQYFGNALPPEALESFQIEKRVLEQMVNEKLLNMAARDNKIIVGDKPALTEIISIPQFQKGDKKFDDMAFKEFLNSRGETEESFTKSMKDSIARQMIMSALTTGFIVPTEMVEEIYKYDGEKRVARTITVPKSFVSSVREPSESELVEYYESEKRNFATPEYRDISYVIIDKNSVDVSAEVTDEAVRKSYEERLAEFTKPESRSVLLMVFDDEVRAKEAHAKLQAGEDFMAVAKSAAGQDEGQTKYGATTKADFMAELSDATFALKQGEYTAPIASDLGWHIVKVEKIEPSEAKSFESVKDAVKKDLFATKYDELLYSLSNKIEDKIAGGATLEEIAKDVGVKVQVIKGISAEGKSPKGDTVQGLPTYENFLPTAFSTAEGELSEQAHTSDGGTYFVVKTDKIDPQRTKALDEVKGLVISSWKEKKKDELVYEIAGFAAKKFEQSDNFGKGSITQSLLDKELPDFSKDGGRISGDIEVSTIGPIRRVPEITTKQTPKEMIDELFRIEVGKATGPNKIDNGAYMAAKLTEIIPVDTATSKEGLGNTRASVEQEFSDDVWQQYLNYLRLVYPIKIHEERMTSPEKEIL